MSFQVILVNLLILALIFIIYIKINKKEKIRLYFISTPIKINKLSKKMNSLNKLIINRNIFMRDICIWVHFSELIHSILPFQQTIRVNNNVSI